MSTDAAQANADAAAVLEVERNARRVDIAMAVPPSTIEPLLADVFKRQADEAIVIIDTERSASTVPASEVALLASIVRRDVLNEALRCHTPDHGDAVRRRVGHVPFVIVDHHGTTVLFLAVGPVISAPGGIA